MKNQVVTFRCTEAQRNKLQALAAGMQLKPASVLARLIEDAPVQPVQVSGLTLKKNNSRAQVLTGQSATAVGA